MTKIYNRKNMQERRRRLRRRATKQEKALYGVLRRRQLEGAKFHFNPSIGHYVVDFYCPEYRLVIELDGSQHDTFEGRGNDSVRTEFLASLGIRVLRFTNGEGDPELEHVVSIIRSTLEERRASSLRRGAYE